MVDQPVSENPHRLEARARLGSDEPWGPYWVSMFPTPGSTGFIRWKQLSTGVAIARGLWEARERLREQLAPASCTPAVIYHPAVFAPVCLACTWLGSSSASPLQASRQAVAHVAGPGHDPLTLTIAFANQDPDRAFRGTLPSQLRDLTGRAGSGPARA